jgi:hypothetical protein
MQYLVTGEFIEPGPLLPPISLLGCSDKRFFLPMMFLQT